MKDFAYDAQLAAIPETVSAVIGQSDIPALDPARRVIFTGIGTSLHAARVAASWVTALTGDPFRAMAVDAHDLGTGLIPLTGGETVVSISHRGYKIFPRASLDLAQQSGCVTVAIVGDEAPEQTADATVRTCRNETAGCFSVSYQATLAALARLIAPWDSDSLLAAALPSLPAALQDTLSRTVPHSKITELSKCEPMLISGFGIDLVTAQEAALKLKEGAWLWTEAMSPEFALHGTPAAYHPGMSAIVLMPKDNDRGRSGELVGVLKALGLRQVLTAAEDDGELSFAAPPHPLLRPALAILPFHVLTASLARHRGTDPDTLHGNREPWASVMKALTL